MEKKIYEKPEFEFININIHYDVLSASRPGGGSWGYFDEDPTETTANPYDPYDDFWD